MNPHIPLGMVFRRLWHTFRGGDFRKNCLQQMSCIEQFEGPASFSSRKHLCEFIANAFGGNGLNFPSVPLHCLQGCGLDAVCESSGKADRAQHTKLVFLEAKRRFANGSNDAAREVYLAADKTTNFA